MDGEKTEGAAPAKPADAKPPSPDAAVASSVAASDTREPAPDAAHMRRLAEELATLEAELNAAGSSVATVLRTIAKQIVGGF